MTTVLDHARLCGSLDVYLVGAAEGWWIVEGVELTAEDACMLKLRPEGITAQLYTTEAEAMAAFERRASE